MAKCLFLSLSRQKFDERARVHNMQIKILTRTLTIFQYFALIDERARNEPRY